MLIRILPFSPLLFTVYRCEASTRRRALRCPRRHPLRAGVGVNPDIPQAVLPWFTPLPFLITVTMPPVVDDPSEGALAPTGRLRLTHNHAHDDMDFRVCQNLALSPARVLVGRWTGPSRTSSSGTAARDVVANVQRLRMKRAT